MDTFLNGEFLEVGVLDKKELKNKRSAQEIEKTALARLGEGGYNILYNNCEHFALWCKTGISESHQIVNFLNLLLPIKIPVKVSYQKIHTSMSGKYD